MGLSCHGIIEHGTGLSKAYFDQTQAWFEHYHAIEVSPGFSREQKIPLMQEWYCRAHTLMLTEPVRARSLLARFLHTGQESE